MKPISRYYTMFALINKYFYYINTIHWWSLNAYYKEIIVK